MPPAATATSAGTIFGIKLGATTIGMTAAQAATNAALIAAGVGTYSSIQQGEIAEQTGKYNAELATRDAQTIKEASAFEEREARVEGRKLRARQLLQFAKGNVVPSGGTPLLVQEETAARTARDITLQKYGYGLQYSRSMSQAKLSRMMGKSKSRASRWQAGSSLLTGAYRASSIYT